MSLLAHFRRKKKQEESQPCDKNNPKNWLLISVHFFIYKNGKYYQTILLINARFFPNFVMLQFYTQIHSIQVS